MNGGRAALAEALRAATVMVSAGDRIGTGFFVAPGQVLTCAHVVTAPGVEPPEQVVGQWDDREFKLAVTQSGFLEEHDLALLKVVGELDHPVACLAEQMEPGDELWAYGHPDGAYRQGDVIRSVYDGPSVNAEGVELLRVTEGRATEGFSGGPVLNWRTGGVCGVLRRADAPPGGPPGARLIGAARIFEAVPDLKPPSVPTPDRLPWFRLLDERQLAAGRWCHPSPRLRGYLEAAQLTAREHPYRLALANTPQLGSVYLRQQASPLIRGQEAKGDGDDLVAQARPVHADRLLEGDRRCVFVVGGPGTGKSSLLRHLAETSAGRWLDGAGAPGVPVLVPAGALAADCPLPEALADGVTAALGARLADRRLADLFEDEPLPGVPWVVLVDGVDEILDPERRRRVLETVAFWRSRSSRYSFLVTTRPLPQGQLDRFREDGLPFYEIEPFSPDQLPEFAGKWFTALDMPDPDALVASFLDRLALSRLNRLAEIPLIATMLCVVFASRDGRRLPPSRVGLYEEFVSILMAKRHTQMNALERLQQRMKPYGTAAEQAVDKLLADLRPLLDHIADQRLGGQGREALLDLAVARVADLRPAHLPTGEWRDLVDETLRLSGLVVERSGELEFFHQTILEYLAVCARETPADIVPEMNFGTIIGRSSFALLRSAVLIERSPGQARDVAVALRDTGLVGMAFLAALVNDGVEFPDDVVDEVRNELEELSAHADGEWSSRRNDALEALTLIDPDLGFGYWERFAADNGLGHFDRREAIRGLVRAGPGRAAAVLEPLALGWETPFPVQQAIVYELTVLNRRRSDELLAKMAMAEHIGGETRRWAAAGLLDRLDWFTRAEILETIASERRLPGSYRRWAAARLFTQDPPRGADALTTVAEDRTVPDPDRLSAVATMVSTVAHRRILRPRAADLFAVIAVDPAVEAPYRVKAAKELMQLAGQRAQSAFALIAADRYADGVSRARAAAALADFDAVQAVAALSAIAADPASGTDGRLEAALALAWINRPRAADALLALAADRRVPEDDRVVAAHHLDWVDRSALPSALTAIAHDERIAGAHWTHAALRLSRLTPETGRTILETLVTDDAISACDRLEIACRLAVLNSTEAPAALAALSADPDLDGVRRLHAAMEAGAPDPLAALATDTGLDGMHRVRAAFELAAIDQARGTDALATLSKDPTTDDARAGLARAETARVRRARKNYFRSKEAIGEPPEIDLSQIASYRVLAARLLGFYDREAAIDHLTALTSAPDENVADQALTTLAKDFS
jgi:hypothetical protein